MEWKGWDYVSGVIYHEADKKVISFHAFVQEISKALGGTLAVVSVFL